MDVWKLKFHSQRCHRTHCRICYDPSERRRLWPRVHPAEVALDPGTHSVSCRAFPYSPGVLAG